MLLFVGGGVEFIDTVVTDEVTGEIIGIVAFLFLSRIGENGTVPLAVLVNVSGVSSSTGLVYYKIKFISC